LRLASRATEIASIACRSPQCAVRLRHEQQRKQGRRTSKHQNRKVPGHVVWNGVDKPDAIDVPCSLANEQPRHRRRVVQELDSGHHSIVPPHSRVDERGNLAACRRTSDRAGGCNAACCRSHDRNGSR
jgi:hypothetical protein